VTHTEQSGKSGTTAQCSENVVQTATKCDTKYRTGSYWSCVIM